MAKFGVAEWGVGLGPSWRAGVLGSGLALNASCMQRLRRAIGGCFERRFLAIVEVFFVIG